MVGLHSKRETGKNENSAGYFKTVLLKNQIACSIYFKIYFYSRTWWHLSVISQHEQEIKITCGFITVIFFVQCIFLCKVIVIRVSYVPLWKFFFIKMLYWKEGKNVLIIKIYLFFIFLYSVFSEGENTIGEVVG